MLFLILILSIGALTTFSDLKSKKIHNWHLSLGALLGLAAIIYTAVWTHENVLFHFINGLIAFVAGTYFYRSGVWRGGDAKLFMLYAFLMPALEHDRILISGAINLFACSFIIAMIIIMPIFIKDIISNYKPIATRLWINRNSMFQGCVASILFSWIMFPVYYLVRIKSPAIILTISYLIFIVGYKSAKKDETVAKVKFLEAGSNGREILNKLINKDILDDFSPTEVRLNRNTDLKEDAVREIAKGDFDKIWAIFQQTQEGRKHFIINFLKKKSLGLCVGIPFGFLMRFWLSPYSLSWPTLPYSICYIGLFSILSAGLHIAFGCLKKYHDRVAFAPLLLTGCVLSYTPFLTWVMHHMHR